MQGSGSAQPGPEAYQHVCGVGITMDLQKQSMITGHPPLVLLYAKIQIIAAELSHQCQPPGHCLNSTSSASQTSGDGKGAHPQR